MHDIGHRRGAQRAFEEADGFRLLHLGEVMNLRGRVHGHHGLRIFDSVAAAHRVPPDVKSELERRFLELCEAATIPLPTMNVHVEGHLVDCHWPANRVVVELDGWAYHRTRTSHEHDHAQTELELAGYEVIRFTWLQVTERQEQVVERVRRALAGTAS